MSVDLVNISFKLTGLTSSEKSVLNVLAFRADEKNECFPSMRSLSESTALNIKTVQLAISSLIDKKLINKTGSMRGKTKRTPVYKLTLNTPKIGCVQNLNTPNFSINTPKIGGIKYPQNRVTKRSDLKDQRKGDFLNSKGPKHISKMLELLKNQP